jgi:hypothetical protein
MKLIAKALLVLTILMLVPGLIQAQEDRYGARDTVYADLTKIDDTNWSITISYFNDENVVGLTVPFKMDAGTNKIVADSAVYTGGRLAEAEWTYLGFRPDTAIQCVTLGMIATLSPAPRKLTPGSGRIATVFVSSLEDKPIESLTIDTTLTRPGNRLMAVLDMVQGELPDTTRVDRTRRNFTPAWVVRYPTEE